MSVDSFPGMEHRSHDSTAAASLLRTAAFASAASASDDPALNQAYNDHVAYVAAFVLPILIPTCSAARPDDMAKAAPLYFRFADQHQTQIERGRLLTLSERAPDDTLQHCRADVLETRIGGFDGMDSEARQTMCDGAIGVLSGMKLAGEWQPRN